MNAALRLLALSLAFCGAAAAQGPAGRPAETGAIPVKVEVSPAFAALEQGMTCASGRAQRLYITVENEGPSEIVLRSAEVLAPDEVETCRVGAPDRPLPQRVGAGRKVVVETAVGTEGAVRPGTVPLIMKLGISGAAGGDGRTDELLVADEVELRIPGLSDILKLVGVPTLFLLPGVLLLGGYFFFSPPGPSARIAPNSLGFWIAAISFSLAVSTLLEWTGIRDLNAGITLRDVAWLWAGCLVAGGLVGGFVHECRELKARLAKEAEAARLASITVTANEAPLELLAKLARVGARWPLDWVRVYDPELAQGAGSEYFRIATGATQWLVSPAIAERPAGVADEAWSEAQVALDELVRSEPSLAALVAGLQRLEPRLKLAWPKGKAPIPLEPHLRTQTRDPRLFVDLG